jgi:hypothetical protein
MSQRTQITLSDRQHRFLLAESSRTGLSIAELVRRSIDRVYQPHARPRTCGIELSVGFWTRPDAAIAGRRPSIRLARGE